MIVTIGLDSWNMNSFAHTSIGFITILRHEKNEMNFFFCLFNNYSSKLGILQIYSKFNSITSQSVTYIYSNDWYQMAAILFGYCYLCDNIIFKINKLAGLFLYSYPFTLCIFSLLFFILISISITGAIIPILYQNLL